MKFIFADSLDHVDPAYDFLRDRYAETRVPYWDDVYPHEIMGYAPYDGMLVSRGIVGGSAVGGKYTEAQAMRFRRVGAREFLRLEKPALAKLPIFGDCGAFTYHKEERPPYTPEDTAEFYDDGRFTHGCSVDHIIFDFNESLSGFEGGTEDARRRFDITLENAAEFLKATAHMSRRFIPLGVIQGWSPGSMAEAARRLVAMGYDYLALGGTVPLKSAQIKACLRAIRDAIPSNIRLHILGFAKADEIETFQPFNITSFDTTSPLIRAFKDGKSNYYLPTSTGALTYYTAIRVPQALENPKLQRLAKQGALNQEQLVSMEYQALSALRAYDRGEAALEETLEAVLAYATPALMGAPIGDLPGVKAAEELRNRYRRTLTDKPWKMCGCPICTSLSVEVVIFRASNRNKRRGIHNLGVYEALVRNLPCRSDFNDNIQVSGDQGAAERSTYGGVVCSPCL
ncbi:archaeosine tRNA-ribosyltransferase type 5 (plasmid) [Sinorhizobium americanum CCGM7]|uniref:tRNA-guanine transglycosylase DpdA n=1 Tax=Sinorhizobium americanum TaxID=194963 RepID=UPI0004D4BA27|nr:tRNA-guanine transglycosylase DpdA [Sinorhizobium americanum]APG86983.1 archaeosine tRNA-ribosyltransferase type 5 [Sinorhizobium americanum CCGM7]